MIITDFHTHTFPDKIAIHAIKSLEKSSNGKAFLNGTNQDLEISMKKAGIDRCVLLPIAVKPENTPTINKVAIANNNNANFVSFGSIHPYYEDYKIELENLKRAGIKGIKLHPDFQQVFIDDPKTVKVMQYATELDLIITIHAGYDVSFPEVHRSTPKRLASVLGELKGARIISAHSGGYQYSDDFEEYLLGKDEVYIDTSYSLDKMDTKQLERIYSNIDYTKILFGTDSPWDDQTRVIKRFMELNISDKIKRYALSENAERLLK